ncbi:hypothetical protein [Palleronia caenipelagi]|uniref:Uncharacterized protein n=1 Tax=Palleronia caenipelagi TaxID=2489174 RepID=A0A547Q595_9RHOB|nr:hypothetical protein [Palleronia caenipelagi]TRD21561.1 hypothetical protein FEV53_08750 [Palleronia caenipelagi]
MTLSESISARPETAAWGHIAVILGTDLPPVIPQQTAFVPKPRNFCRAYPCLHDNLGPEDQFDDLQPVADRTISTSDRKGPGKDVFTITHMEGGESAEFDPLTLPIPGLTGGDWRCIRRTPGIDDDTGGRVILKDSPGLAFKRTTE